MAVLTWFLNNTAASTHQGMDEAASTNALSTPATGWTVGKVAAGSSASFNSGVEVGTASFTNASNPQATIATATGDCWRSTNTYSGSFAAGNWTVYGSVIADTFGGDQDGFMSVRLWHGPQGDGTGASQVTTARNNLSVVTNLATNASQNSSGLFNPQAFSVVNEYIFLQVGWEVTGAGGGNTRDVILVTGSLNSRVLTSTWTATPAAALQGQPTMIRGQSVPILAGYSDRPGKWNYLKRKWREGPIRAAPAGG